MIKIINAKKKHIDSLKDNLRKQDMLELTALLGENADVGKVLADGLKGKKCWTILRKKDSKPIAMFGVTSYGQDKVGAVWLLGTEDIEKVGLSILRKSKRYIKDMLHGFEAIHNVVHVDNNISINWLRWCGFEFREDTLDIGGETFIYFYMRGSNV